MKKLTVLLLGTILPLSAIAGEAKVNFLDFKEYRDVRPSNEVRGSYHKRIATQFEKHVSKLAQKLPPSFTLNLKFDDIDLAGDVQMSMNDIRVIKAIYFPKLKITYTVTDNGNNVLLQGKEVSLKDMSFMDRSKIGRDESFYYDKRLLTQWFDEDVLAKLPPS
jgi:hypothetical protein